MKKPASLYYVTIELDGCSTVAIVRAYDVRQIRSYFGRIVVWDELDVSSNNEPDFDLTLPPSYKRRCPSGRAPTEGRHRPEGQQSRIARRNRGLILTLTLTRYARIVCALPRIMLSSVSGVK